MTQRNKRIFVISAVILILFSGGLFLWKARQTARRNIEQERLDAEAAGRVEVISTKVAPPNMDGVSTWLKTTETRAFIAFRDRYYAASGGGLVAFSKTGGEVARYATADGLPENDLTALAVFRDRLFIGTRTSGLLEFDGQAFTRHNFNKPKALHVTTLAATNNFLLVGTQDGGLFDYDGTGFSRRFQPPRGAVIKDVTSLLAVETRLYIGTRADGLFLWREGELSPATARENLPSANVTALLKFGGDIIVATDSGVVKLNGDQPPILLSRQPYVTSLAEFDGRIFAGLVLGGVVEIQKNGTSVAQSRINRFAPIGATEAGKPRRVTLAVLDDALWAATDEGIQKLTVKPGRPPEWQRWSARGGAGPELLAAHTTCLTFDQRGRLWIGTFENGISVVSPTTGEVERNLRDEKIREINALATNSATGDVLAATSAGVIRFDPSLKSKVLDEKSAALVGNSVSHVLPLAGYAVNGPRFQAATTNADPPLVLSTSKGLTVMQSGVSRSLTAFHGLASNYLYCSEMVGGKLYVGSLGGLMEFDGLKVVRTWKTDNSQLPANWINALANLNGTLFVGTYGGGVCALKPNGEIERFDDMAGIEVNLNAMAADGDRLYVGTLDRGLLVFDSARRTWRAWRVGLASPNVTAIAVRGETVFVGTTGGVNRIEKRRFAG